MDDIFEESGDEEESQDIVNQVLDEIGIEISGKVRRQTRRSPARACVRACQTLSFSALLIFTSLQQRNVGAKCLPWIFTLHCRANVLQLPHGGARPQLFPGSVCAPQSGVPARPPICRVSGSPCGPS